MVYGPTKLGIGRERKMAEYICQCCSKIISVGRWLTDGQSCRFCGGTHAKAAYAGIERKLGPVLSAKCELMPMYLYSELLPSGAALRDCSFGEGAVIIERWKHMEALIDEVSSRKVKIYAHRHDGNPATGSFKDLAGASIASGLKRYGKRTYVVASTGNIGVSLARYLAAAGIELTAVLPKESPPGHEMEITSFGQEVIRVAGNYADAKERAEFVSRERGAQLAGGSTDPFRVEAKRTMVFEWFRRLRERPTKYIQALSGGTGPLGIAKGYEDLEEAGLLKGASRASLHLIQASGCTPMVEAWENATRGGFREGWEEEYPVIDDVKTTITTLGTGNPSAFPYLGPVVKEAGGGIYSFPEDHLVAVGRWAAERQQARVGRAAAVAVGGLIKNQKEILEDGDVVVLNIGEGVRRDPEFGKEVGGVDCGHYGIDEYVKRGLLG